MIGHWPKDIQDYLGKLMQANGVIKVEQTT